jgi:chemotaxis protein histidine kinase CheA
MDDLIKEFLVESYENLDRLDRDFVELEKNPSIEALRSIFRAIHTIKGTCGFLGFSKLELVSHAGENLLSLLRDGQLQVSPPITNALLAMVDAIRQILASLEANGSEGERDDSALIGTLGRLQKGETLAAAPQVDAPAMDLPQNPKKKRIRKKTLSSSPTPAAPPPGVQAAEHAEPRIGEILVQQGQVTPEDVERALDQQAQGDPHPVGEILVQQGSVKPAEVLEALQSQSESKAAISDSTVRVDVGLLDKLMNLVGELVLSRNQIMQFAANQEDAMFAATSQHLNLVTGELQEGVMKTRMQPIGNVWNKFPRVVRDLAAACGKQVRVEMEGAETELDRTIIEAIKDPLTHVVRNSVDHGIESPEVRVAAGKPAEGCLLLRAYHEGGQVNIEISDNGGGVNPEKVREKALQKGLINPDQAARMSERELVNLIFLPGFSTAEKVTNVSGRGVGMDVVKTNIEKIGGTVDVQSKPAQGTTLKVKIPLTLAIIPALMVTTGGDRYAIPQVSLLELVRLEGERARKGVEMVHGAPVYRLRGNLLPIVYLNAVLALNGRSQDHDGEAKSKVKQSGLSLDFESARYKHLLWKVRLRAFLDGREALSEAQAVDHTQCDLGRWLYTNGLKEYEHLPAIHELEQAHAQLHLIIRQILELKQSGEKQAAEQEMTKVEPLSQRIIELISEVEQKAIEAGVTNIVVLQADGRQFGLVVDGINDSKDIVVKPLGRHLKGLSTFSGATIMGDGKVALILDVIGISQSANVVSEARERAINNTTTALQETSGDRRALLICRHGSGDRVAIPLSLVARLEQFPLSTVERSNAHEVVQYRGEIMPLVQLSQVLGGDGCGEESKETIEVVVYSERGKSVGLVVDQIIDIVEERITVKSDHQGGHLVGTAVVQGKVTDILDVRGVIESVDPTYLAQVEAA